MADWHAVSSPLSQQCQPAFSCDGHPFIALTLSKVILSIPILSDLLLIILSVMTRETKEQKSMTCRFRVVCLFLGAWCPRGDGGQIPRQTPRGRLSRNLTATPSEVNFDLSVTPPPLSPLVCPACAVHHAPGTHVDRWAAVPRPDGPAGRLLQPGLHRLCLDAGGPTLSQFRSHSARVCLGSQRARVAGSAPQGGRADRLVRGPCRESGAEGAGTGPASCPERGARVPTGAFPGGVGPDPK